VIKNIKAAYKTALNEKYHLCVASYQLLMHHKYQFLFLLKKAISQSNNKLSNLNI
jgi:hypothetical protein